MTLEHLRVFVAVAERQHMTRAAEQLGMAQSAVSANVAALEAHNGVHLFHRIGRRIELTETGRLLLHEAKAILARVAAVEIALSEQHTSPRGRLSIWASQTIANYRLPKYLVDFHRDYPVVEIHLAVGNTAQVAEAVRNGSAELGFAEGVVLDPTLLDQKIKGDRLVLVTGMNHRWATRTQIKASELLDEEWVVREQGSGTRSEFEAALRMHDIRPDQIRICLELPSNEAVRSAVAAGAGVTAISELVVEALIRLGQLHQIDFELPKRPFHVLRHRERYHTKAAKALLASIGVKHKDDLCLV